MKFKVSDNMENKSKRILNIAKNKNFAIPSANFIDTDTLKAYLLASKESNLPLILSIAEAHLDYIDFDEAYNLAKFYIKKYNLENIILHLDHGKSSELIKRAIDLGFDSVMIDASNETFEENVRLTKEIVEYAHLKNVFVEAEIGHVGSDEVIGISCSDEDKNIYTTKEEALEFVKQTNVDSLAISIGTLHGKYKGTPKINFERLKEIRQVLDIPLVLHGGSSSGDENLKKCSKEGINKINLYTDFIVAGQQQFDNSKNYYDNKKLVIEAIKNKLLHYYKVFETKGI